MVMTIPVYTHVSMQLYKLTELDINSQEMINKAGKSEKRGLMKKGQPALIDLLNAFRFLNS